MSVSYAFWRSLTWLSSKLDVRYASELTTLEIIWKENAVLRNIIFLYQTKWYEFNIISL